MAACVEGHADHPLVSERASEGSPVVVDQLIDSSCSRRGERRCLDPLGQGRPEGHQVGVDARVGLDIGVIGAEQDPGMIGGGPFDDVDVVASGVHASADRSFGVLVAQPVTHGEEDRGRCVVLAGDQLERGTLISELLAYGRSNGGLNPGDDVQSGVPCVPFWRRVVAWCGIFGHAGSSRSIEGTQAYGSTSGRRNRSPVVLHPNASCGPPRSLSTGVTLQPPLCRRQDRWRARPLIPCSEARWSGGRGFHLD